MLYVACLYVLLASPHHSTRAASEKELLHRVSGWPHLYGEQAAKWAATTSSPERRHRLHRAAIAYRAWLAANYRPPTPVWPCCDMMPGVGPEVRDRDAGSDWYAAAEDEGETRGPYFHRWRRGTELMARQMIRDGRKSADVDALLLRMWAIELDCECDRSAPREVLESWTWEGGYPCPR